MSLAANLWRNEIETKAAVLSVDGLYRYVLARRWFTGNDRAVFVMLNPSKADANIDDPTIRRCENFAVGWGFAELLVVNLFAYRATDYRELKKVSDPVGTENDYYISEAAKDGEVILAWGCHIDDISFGAARLAEVAKLLPQTTCAALGTTSSGQPRHPLMLRADILPRPFPVALLT